MSQNPQPEPTRPGSLPEFAAWAYDQAPSGHAAGIVAAILKDEIIINFGTGVARFKADSFPDVGIGDFVTVGPAVTRWTWERS